MILSALPLLITTGVLFASGFQNKNFFVRDA